MVLVAVIGVCAGGLMHLLNQTVLRDHLDHQIGYATYSSEYVEENRGKVIVEIPEVFELANIAIAISEEGLKHPNRVRKRGAYYERVLEHFKPFKDHPLIAEPDMHRNFNYFFRDNAACYVFDGNKIVRAGIYSKMRTPNLFRKHLAQAVDFAKVSGFRKFYRENQAFYQEQLQRYKQKVPIRKMWAWLQEKFPARHDCYKVVFSPLIGGSHETRHFQSKGFSETIMFISGPGEGDDYSDAVGEALLARVVFSEIDHNYVNRVTKRYVRRVKKAFAELNEWNRQSGYRSSESTFNEYMTWAVFILYAHDNYDAQTFKVVKERVGNQMIDRRKFVRFKEFSDQLLKLYLSRSEGQSIVDLYPAILDWADTLPK
jgi:hypothetical protein